MKKTILATVICALAFSLASAQSMKVSPTSKPRKVQTERVQSVSDQARKGTRVNVKAEELKVATVGEAVVPVAAAPAPEKYEYGVFYFQRATLFDQLPVYEDDIIMLGNSLTNGCEWHELFGMPNIKNRGISSDVVQGVDDRLGSIINGQPAKIFLMTGINDISHNLGPDSVGNAYLNLIKHIRAEMPKTKLYVESCLPINISFGKYLGMKGRDEEIRQLNKILAEHASELGYTYIDLYPAFADEEGHLHSNFTNDGLHLLGPGYLAWRDCILPYIQE